MMADCCDLSVVIPALHEGVNLELLLPDLRGVPDDLGIRYQLPLEDLPSGFRLYNGDVVRAQNLAARDFDILPEIAVSCGAD